MSDSSVKATRRAIRRSAGEAAIGVIRELQQNHTLLANSLTLAHQRIDRLFAQHAELLKRVPPE
jgi:hypothetical protein